MKQELEKRSFQMRADDDEEYVLSGYAVVFNSPADIAGLFEETVNPKALDRTLASGRDVKCLSNHQSLELLARTKNGSLKLETDNHGLKFRAQLDKENPLHQQIWRSVKTELMNTCSFGFWVKQDRWNAAMTKRELLDVELDEVSVVIDPAYPTTEVAARAATETGGNKAGLERLRQIDADYERNCKANRLRAEIAGHSTTTTTAEPTHAELKAKAERLAKQHGL